MNDEAFGAALRVLEALEQLHVPCFIGGSLASSVFGTPRSTYGADLVAELDASRAQALADILGRDFYSDAAAIRDAVARRSSFNVIHLATMMKVDVFVPKDRPFDREQFRRVVRKRFDPDSERRIPFSSPEDTILAKLEWYRIGDEISDRQWLDILGVLKLQGESLDYDYLKKWARSLSVDDLLARAMKEALA